MSEIKNYCELIYKPAPSAKKSLGKAMLIAVYSLFILLYLFLFWFTVKSYALIILLPFIMFAMIRVTWRLVNTEYEISLEAGEIKFSVIYGKAGRKTKFRYDVREMSVIAPYDDDHAHLFEQNDITDTKLFFGISEGLTAYACVCPDIKKSTKTLAVFMCSDEMKKLLRLSNPSAFKA